MSKFNAFSSDDTQFIKVYVRPRPLNETEIKNNSKNIINKTLQHDIFIQHGGRERRYVFDKVFREATTQSEIYRTVVSPMIRNIVSGINCTLLAYGQTGTGKTYTLSGDSPKNGMTLSESDGMIPRAAVTLFEELQKVNAAMQYAVQVSFIEIYNEEVRDLLVQTDNSQCPLRLFDDNKGSVKIMHLNEMTVLDHLDIFRYFMQGSKRRQTHGTNLNSQSSRSHAVFTITVTTKSISTSGEEILKVGKLNLVDLAGSENIVRSGATNERAKEAMNINKSLLTLTKVITSLAKKCAHIPYRESKLTRILQDSLGGNTKTSLVATISPSLICSDETVSTLEYAQVARGIENCPRVNETKLNSARIEELHKEIKLLQRELDVARSGRGFYITQELFDQLNEKLQLTETEVNNMKLKEIQLIHNYETLEHALESEKFERDRLHECFAKTEEHRKSIEEKLNMQNRKSLEDQFVIEQLAKRDEHVTNVATELLNVCNTSVKNEDIFHRKYESVVETLQQNSQNVLLLHRAYNDYLSQIERFGYESPQRLVEDCKCWIKSLEMLHTYTANISTCFNDMREKLETHYSKGENELHDILTECRTSVVDKVVGEVTDRQADIEENISKLQHYQTVMAEQIKPSILNAIEKDRAKAIEATEISTKRRKRLMHLLNTMVQEIENWEISGSEILDQQSEHMMCSSLDENITLQQSCTNTLLMSTAKLKDLPLVTADALDRNLSNVKICCASICNKENVDTISCDLENSIKNVGDKLNSVHETGNKLCNALERTRVLIDQAKSASKNIIDRLVFDVRKGDTPIKKTYSFSTSIELPMPIEALRRKFHSIDKRVNGTDTST